jgi:shikimate dehydrogenase
MGLPYAEVIGDPIAHSKSPLIHKYWLGKLGMEADYRATRVRSHELADYLAHRRSDPDWRGCNVTLPHKQAIQPFLDEISDVEIGAVNCVVPRRRWIGRRCRLAGCNTDLMGLERAFNHDVVGFGEPGCVIGAGGAAAAALVTLNCYCVVEYRLLVRETAKGRMLLDRLGMAGSAFELKDAKQAISGCTVLINASPLGMTGFPSMPEEVLGSLEGLLGDRLVLDMVYSPLLTELLDRAGKLGLATVDGLTMLIGQARGAFRAFFGIDPPPFEEAVLRELLAS